MLRLLSASVLLLSLASPTQAPRDPAPKLPAAIRRALPAGYAVLAAAPGDLNRDAVPDWLVVLHRPDEAKTSDVIDHPTKRPLLVFVGARAAPTPWPRAPTMPCTAWIAGA